MSKVSYIDDNFILVDCCIKKDYSALADQIIMSKEEKTYIIEDGILVAGYDINYNMPLSKLYGSSFYVVRFVFANIDTLHKKTQEELLLKLFLNLKEKIECEKGYYNLRLPSHIVDVIKAYNYIFNKGIFCGGTVEEYIHGKSVVNLVPDGMELFLAMPEYIKEHKKQLLDMTYKSFKSYQGQYHISPVTEALAGKIYENWIEGSLNLQDGNIVVISEIYGVPAGFVTVTEKDNAVEGVLSAVNGSYRKAGAYRAMISYIINYAQKQGKSFITSTQFDNFIVQGVWASLGLAPFYSLYNFHIDMRN
ncbi:MAG: hypothetical protein HFH68_01825 [Lachnospiraceae bacterium]|nr:hypothetical protein [Lachnospiraceae bacterium]